MSSKRLLLCIAWLMVAASAASAGQLAVTVYNQDFGVVKDTRQMDIASGRSSLTLEDVAARIDPTSVQFTCLSDPSCRVVEQNFDYDLVSVAKLLQKMIDQPVTLVGGEGRLFEGALLSFEGNRMTLAGDDALNVFHLDDNYREIRLPELPDELLLKPALVWQVKKGKAGKENVEVAYQTAGLTWRADYNVLLRPEAKRLDLNAWVTITNTSGGAYPNCALKLVAGEVHKVKEPEPMRFAGRARAMKMDVAMQSAVPKGFEERSFAEYHLYALGRSTTLYDNQTKQIEMFDPKSDLKFRTVYKLVQGGRHYGYRRGRSVSLGDQGQPLDVVVTFENKEENNMGIPLPAGKVRLYQRDSSGQDHMVGEDSIDHTPKDEKVRLTVGKSFDVLGGRRQTNRNQISETVFTEDYEIRVRNHKRKAITVIVDEQLYNGWNWTIENPTDDFAKKDYRTIEFKFELPGNTEKTITYRVRYERYEW